MGPLENNEGSGEEDRGIDGHGQETVTRMDLRLQTVVCRRVCGGNPLTSLRPSKERFMNPIVLILVVLLLLSLFGGGYGFRRGNNALAGGGGLVGLVLIILIVLFLLGRL